MIFSAPVPKSRRKLEGGNLHVTGRPEDSNQNAQTKANIPMAYEIAGGSPAVMSGKEGFGPNTAECDKTAL